jgi:putative hydrolase of the HAD superfamily
MSRYALWVDLDGTLVDYDEAVRRAVAAFVTLHDAWGHVDAAALADAWQASRRGVILDGSRPLGLQRGARMADVARRFGVQSDEASAKGWGREIADLAVSRCRRYPDVDEFLDRIGTVGVITNGERSFQEGKLSAAGLDLRRFDPFVASMEVGAAKPSPAIYRAAAATRRVAPSRCVMVGDSPRADVAAALAAGYAAAVLIDRSPRPRPGSATSLTAALSILSSHGIEAP